MTLKAGGANRLREQQFGLEELDAAGAGVRQAPPSTGAVQIDGPGYVDRVTDQQSRGPLAVQLRAGPPPPNEHGDLKHAPAAPSDGEHGGTEGLTGDQTPVTVGIFGNAPQLNPLGPVSNTPPPGAVQTPTDFTRQVRSNFSDWDTDGDGYLREAEIDRAIMDASVTGDSAAAAATLKRMVGDLEDLSDDQTFGEDGVSLADITNYEKHMGRPAADRPSAVSSSEAWYGHYQGKIAGASADLFPTGSADVNAMHQGSIGDCYLHAVAGSLVAQDPNALNGMIQPRDGGGYTVTFPGQDPIGVDELTDGEIARYGTAGANGRWLAVLEKAYGQHRGGTTIPGDAADGVHLSEAAELLTGHDSDTDMLRLTSDAELERELSDALANDRAVSADSWPGLFSKSGEDDGIVLGHAFSVIGHDPANDTVTLRNPWGRQEFEGADGRPADGVDDGVFTMTYDEFRSHFRYVNYEQAR